VTGGSFCFWEGELRVCVAPPGLEILRETDPPLTQWASRVTRLRRSEKKAAKLPLHARAAHLRRRALH
jgi:hypothetical protein